jgi:RNA polymerase sigma-70 factor, ECF subfamily
MEISGISNELLRKASEGDIAACEEVYKASSGFVYNVALRIVCNNEEAQEVTQETFIKVFNGLKSFKFQSSFKTWIYRIGVNMALNARKKFRKYLDKHTELNEAIETGNSIKEDSVENIACRNSDKETVNNLLDKLNEEQRVCVVLREMQGLSYAEISQTLGININTVRTRLKRARETLIKRMCLK